MSNKRKKSSKRSGGKLPAKAAKAAQRGIDAHQRGDLGTAEANYRTALSLAPNNTDLCYNLGLICAQSGRLDEAAALMEQTLASGSQDPAVLTTLGNIQREMGQLPRAHATYTQALTLDESNPNTRFNLGVLSQQLGDLEQARTHLEWLTQRDPGDAAAWNMLGLSWLEGGQLVQADRCLNRAFELDPKNPDIITNRARLKTAQGRFDEIETSLRQLLSRSLESRGAIYAWLNGLCRDQRASEAHDWVKALPGPSPVKDFAERRLAEVAQNTSDFPIAAEVLANILTRDRSWIGGRIQYATSLMRSGDESKAREVLEQAVADFAGNLDALSDAGLAFRLLGDSDRAIALFEEARGLAPQDTLNLNNIGMCLVDRGEIAQAEATFDEVLRLDPVNAHALYNRSRTQRYKSVDHPFVVQLKEASKAASGRFEQDPDSASMIEFALGKVYNDLGNADLAFTHYANANQLQAKLSRYDRQRSAEWVDALIETFDEALFTGNAASLVDDTLPVLIVGMPRSGTTLVEQIIASHPAAFGAGELRNLAAISMEIGSLTDEPYPRGIQSLTPETYSELASRYLEGLRALDAEAKRITDKLPTNFLHVGLARLLLPGVRIIHCRRDPTDTCFANFIQHFTEGHRYSYDLDDTAHFYGQYRRLMNHWDSVLKEPVLTVDYESVVADLETQARRLIDYIGLPWDERCLRYHESERKVETASNWQVRQPIYSEASRRWKRYEVHLQGLREALRREVPGIDLDS